MRNGLVPKPCLETAILASILAMYATAAVGATTKQPEIYLNVDTLVYRGLLTANGEAKAERIYREADRKPSELEIESLGGNVDGAIAFGRWVHDHALRVRIPRYCMSSCANYVLPAGQPTVLSRQTVLMWHGGACSDYTRQIDDAISQEIKERELTGEAADRFRTQREADQRKDQADWRAREESFYRSLGVFPRIACFGQTRARFANQLNSRDYTGWYYTLPAMHRLGLRNVLVIDNASWHPGSESLGIQIFRIGVDDLPTAPANTDGSSRPTADEDPN